MAGLLPGVVVARGSPLGCRVSKRHSVFQFETTVLKAEKRALGFFLPQTDSEA
jgi:hypothetical protein